MVIWRFEITEAGTNRISEFVLKRACSQRTGRDVDPQWNSASFDPRSCIKRHGCAGG